MSNYFLIESGVLKSCAGDVANVEIPENVVEIAKYAFDGCKNVTAITIPKSVRRIGFRPFDNCGNLLSVNVAKENEEFCSEDGVLFSKEKTELIYYPEGRQGDYTVPNRVERIGAVAFGNCTGLTGIKMGNSLVRIEGAAFFGCKALKSVTVPDSVKSIGMYAFGNCESLEKVFIGKSFKFINLKTFRGCSRLSSITVSEKNRRFSSQDGVLFNKAKTHLIILPQGKQGNYSIPESVTRIVKYAFVNCKGLTGVNVPNGVTDIEDYAFAGCVNLKSPVIPVDIRLKLNTEEEQDIKSIEILLSSTHIDKGVFAGCKNVNIDLFDK